MEILSFFQYGFMWRALIAGSFTALICAVLGVLLVLRRLSLIGDGLAHVTFGGVAIGLFLKQHPVYVAIPIVMASSLGILRLVEKARLYGDAAIGIVSSIGIALGVLIASVAGGFNIDIFSFLFGSILSISEAEVLTSILLSIVVLVIVVVFYYENFATAFDEEFAKVSGIDTERINALLVLLTAVTVVLTMKIVGILLTSSLLVLPPVTALQVARSFRSTMATSAICGIASVVAGIFVSFLMNLPTGATIVILNFLLFLAAFTYKSLTRGSTK